MALLNPDSQHNRQPAEPAIPELLATALAAAVPLRMLTLCRCGGPTAEDLARVQSYQNDFSTHGDDLFFQSKKPGGTVERFNQTADAIAVLAFCPGGITIFGAHYDGQQMLTRYVMNQSDQHEATTPDQEG